MKRRREGGKKGKGKGRKVLKEGDDGQIEIDR